MDFFLLLILDFRWSNVFPDWHLVRRDRLYAAIKFFLHPCRSVVMLLGVLKIYSSARTPNGRSRRNNRSARVIRRCRDVSSTLQQGTECTAFPILYLQAMGTVCPPEVFLPRGSSFVAFALGFAIKVRCFRFIRGARSQSTPHCRSSSLPVSCSNWDPPASSVQPAKFACCSADESYFDFVFASS